MLDKIEAIPTQIESEIDNVKKTDQVYNLFAESAFIYDEGVIFEKFNWDADSLSCVINRLNEMQVESVLEKIDAIVLNKILQDVPGLVAFLKRCDKEKQAVVARKLHKEGFTGINMKNWDANSLVYVLKLINDAKIVEELINGGISESFNDLDANNLIQMIYLIPEKHFIDLIKKLGREKLIKILSDAPSISLFLLQCPFNKTMKVAQELYNIGVISADTPNWKIDSLADVISYLPSEEADKFLKTMDTLTLRKILPDSDAIGLFLTRCGNENKEGVIRTLVKLKIMPAITKGWNTDNWEDIISYLTSSEETEVLLQDKYVEQLKNSLSDAESIMTLLTHCSNENKENVIRQLYLFKIIGENTLNWNEDSLAEVLSYLTREQAQILLGKIEEEQLKKILPVNLENTVAFVKRCGEDKEGVLISKLRNTVSEKLYEKFLQKYFQDTKSIVTFLRRCPLDLRREMALKLYDSCTIRSEHKDWSKDTLSSVLYYLSVNNCESLLNEIGAEQLRTLLGTDAHKILVFAAQCGESNEAAILQRLYLDGVIQTSERWAILNYLVDVLPSNQSEVFLNDLITNNLLPSLSANKMVSFLRCFNPSKQKQLWPLSEALIQSDNSTWDRDNLIYVIDKLNLSKSIQFLKQLGEQLDKCIPLGADIALLLSSCDSSQEQIKMRCLAQVLFQLHKGFKHAEIWDIDSLIFVLNYLSKEESTQLLNDKNVMDFMTKNNSLKLLEKLSDDFLKKLLPDRDHVGTFLMRCDEGQRTQMAYELYKRNLLIQEGSKPNLADMLVNLIDRKTSPLMLSQYMNLLDELECKKLLINIVKYDSIILKEILGESNSMSIFLTACKPDIRFLIAKTLCDEDVIEIKFPFLENQNLDVKLLNVLQLFSTDDNDTKFLIYLTGLSSAVDGPALLKALIIQDKKRAEEILPNCESIIAFLENFEYKRRANLASVLIQTNIINPKLSDWSERLGEIISFIHPDCDEMVKFYKMLTPTELRLNRIKIEKLIKKYDLLENKNRFFTSENDSSSNSALPHENLKY